MVGNGHDAREQADRLAHELVGITRTIIGFVVRSDDGQDGRGKLQLLADGHAVLTMHLVQVALGRRQCLWFPENLSLIHI